MRQRTANNHVGSIPIARIARAEDLRAHTKNPAEAGFSSSLLDLGGWRRGRRRGCGSLARHRSRRGPRRAARIRLCCGRGRIAGSRGALAVGAHKQQARNQDNCGNCERDAPPHSSALIAHTRPVIESVWIVLIGHRAVPFRFRWKPNARCLQMFRTELQQVEPGKSLVDKLTTRSTTSTTLRMVMHRRRRPRVWRRVKRYQTRSVRERNARSITSSFKD
jgi:hypothetical protein